MVGRWFQIFYAFLSWFGRHMVGKTTKRKTILGLVATTNIWEKTQSMQEMAAINPSSAAQMLKAH